MTDIDTRPTGASSTGATSSAGGIVAAGRRRQAVADIYAAFGRGDLDAVLGAVAEEVDWGLDPSHPAVAAVPWLGRVGTRAAVASGYFAAVVADLEWHAFEPLAVAEDGDQVVSALRVHFTVRATGRTVDALEAHLFTLGPDLRIVRYRPIPDTAAFVAAFG